MTQKQRVPINLSVEDAIKLKSAITIALGVTQGQDIEIFSQIVKRIDKVLSTEVKNDVAEIK